MTIVGALTGGGDFEVPAGKCGLVLQVTTVDRENMEGCTFAITATGKSYTATSDAGGSAYIEVDSGYSYTVTLTHNGQYTNDDPHIVTTESTGVRYVNFELFNFAETATLVLITTYPGSTVTATNEDGTLTDTLTADASGIAKHYGVSTGDTWTYEANGETVDLLIEHILSQITVGMLYTVTFKAPSGSTITGTSTDGYTMSATADSSGSAVVQVLAKTWTFVSTEMSLTATVNKDMTLLMRLLVYTVNVAISTTDPEDRCTYADDAEGITPASGTSINGWDGCELLAGIKPVRLHNGTFDDLDKTDLSKLTDGSDSNIDTEGYDAFVEVESWWLSITNSGSVVKISFSNIQVDSNYQKYASTFNGTVRDTFHIGCFLATASSSMLYSQAGTSPTVSTSITNFIAYAQARGDGYDITPYYQLVYMQALFVLLYRSTNCQTALGAGYTGGSARQTNAILPYDNQYGLYGSTSTTTRMSFLWLNDFWGNCYWFVGCAKTNSSRQLMTIIDGLSSVTESDFTNRSTTALSSNITGYISAVTGTSLTGFFPSACSGSSTTYWCDYGNVFASYFPYVGGAWSYGANAGCFNARFNYSATYTDTNISARLSYRSGSA